uniref:Chitin-binding type-2 domain-containing protein n=1 Tax=Syphacia muris TaxID=451379 RepID=A0A0N5AHL5_9BILA
MECQSNYVCATVNAEQEVLASNNANSNTNHDDKTCNDGEYRIDMVRCSTYWECVNINGTQTLVEKNCPQGQRFNLALKACQPSPCFTTTTVPSVPAEPPTTTTTSLPTTTQMQKEPPCQESSGIAGFRTDTIDSRRYFQCAQGKWIHMDCPAGLVWNPRALVCDWPKKTVCDEKTSKCT